WRSWRPHGRRWWFGPAVRARSAGSAAPPRRGRSLRPPLPGDEQLAQVKFPGKRSPGDVANQAEHQHDDECRPAAERAGEPQGYAERQPEDRHYANLIHWQVPPFSCRLYYSAW